MRKKSDGEGFHIFVTFFLSLMVFILLCDNTGRGQMKEWGESECRTHGLDFVNYYDNSTDKVGAGTIFVTCFNSSDAQKFITNMTMVKSFI